MGKGTLIFTTGAFLRPIKVIQDGQELWMWTVAEFIDDSFKDGGIFNPPEVSTTQETLFTNTTPDTDL